MKKLLSVFIGTLILFSACSMNNEKIIDELTDENHESEIPTDEVNTETETIVENNVVETPTENNNEETLIILQEIIPDDWIPFEYYKFSYLDYYKLSVTSSKEHTRWTYNHALNLTINSKVYCISLINIDNSYYKVRWFNEKGYYILCYDELKTNKSISSIPFTIKLDGKNILVSSGKYTFSDFKTYFDTTKGILIIRTKDYVPTDYNYSDSLPNGFKEFTKLTSNEFFEYVNIGNDNSTDFGTESIGTYEITTNGEQWYHYRIKFYRSDVSYTMSKIQNIRIIPSDVPVNCTDERTTVYKINNPMISSSNSIIVDRCYDFECTIHMYYASGHGSGNSFFYINLGEGNYRIFHNINNDELIIKYL